MPLKKTRPVRLAIIAGEFHQDLAHEMIATATTEAKKLNAVVTKTLLVPGSYEVPLIANQLLQQKTIDALVVLGYIEKGETLHGEVMGYVVHKALVELQLKYNKPIGLGIIGPGATKQQAKVRKQGTAQGAVWAAIKNYHLSQSLLS